MEGGSRILYADEAVDGDYASDEDIRRLLEGDAASNECRRKESYANHLHT